MKYFLGKWRGIGFLLIIVFLMAPMAAVGVGSFSSTPYVQIPPEVPSIRWYELAMSDPRWRAGFATSMTIASIVALISTLSSSLMIFAMEAADWSRRRQNIVALVIAIPLIVPQVSLGISMMALARTFSIGGSYVAIVVAHLIVVVPYTFIPIMGAFRSLNPQLMKAAMSLGAGPGLAFLKVVLPCLAPGLLAGFLLAFLTSFDEITISLFLVGPGIDLLPVKVMMEVQNNDSPIVAAVSVIIITIMLVFLSGISRAVGLKFLYNKS